MGEITQDDQKLGQGRSGLVFKSRDARGRDIARKVFDSDSVTKLVQYIIMGAPNPYVWSEDAIRCAVLRRQILARLVRHWFGEKLSVAEAYEHRWNAQYRAWEMTCQLIRGRHVLLHHPYAHLQHGELDDVRANVMAPLQKHLIESGFDGLVWQAGLGNPVALNNFMRDNPPQGDEDVKIGDYRWAWIDLESGIPALIPMNPVTLLRYYLPRSFHHRGPLFDDVDLPRLRAYIDDRRDIFGDELDEMVNELGDCQSRWKSMRRFRRSIAFRRSKGFITEQQAAYYHTRPIRWYAREFVRTAGVVWDRGNAEITKLLACVETIDYLAVVRFSWGMVSSQKYRLKTVRTYINNRIDAWNERGQVSDEHAADLRDRLKGSESSRYLIDFGVHVGVKGFVKPLQWTILPALLGMGMIDEWTFGFLIASIGAIVRTLYTLGRTVQNAIKRRELPWIALLLGCWPVIGNLAFPLQIIYTSRRESAKVAKLIVYDTFTKLGQWLPIWGGCDTLIEHLFNRVPTHVGAALAKVFGRED